jgi:uncharacterized membrane protein
MAKPENVIPLRQKRRRQRTQFDLRAPRSQVLLVHALTLATFGLHLISSGPWRYLAIALGVAAVAIAAARRQEGMPWACTHHEFALRTLVFGAVASVLVSLAGLIPGLGAAMIYANLGVLAWVGVRGLWGFGRGLMRLPMLRPRSPLL